MHDHAQRFPAAAIFWGLLWGATASGAWGQTFELLHAFNATNGDFARGTMVQAADGNLYGTTFFGGQDQSQNAGTVFRITPDGNLTTLYSLSRANGYPVGALVEGKDGSLYGTTSGGNGTVFKITTNGISTTLFSFSYTNGSSPRGALVQGSDGNFCGTTAYGGIYSDMLGDTFGTVFRMTPNGQLTTLASFDGTNGAVPLAGLVQATDGNFYGTTSQGGVPPSESYGSGTVFKITPDGTLTTLVRFDGTNGFSPSAGIIQASDGYLFGTTPDGGPYGKGTIFKMTFSGEITNVFIFDGTNAAYPAAEMIEAPDGNFYGTTQGGGLHNDGTVFRLTHWGQLTVLFSFYYWSPVGSYPNGLTLARDGNLYGTTAEGGQNYGAVFRIVMPAILNSTVLSNQIVLSWLTNKVGFTLQSTTDLNSTNWVDCPDSLAVVGAQYTVTNGLSGQRRFYRLKK